MAFGNWTMLIMLDGMENPYAKASSDMSIFLPCNLFWNQEWRSVSLLKFNLQWFLLLFTNKRCAFSFINCRF